MDRPKGSPVDDPPKKKRGAPRGNVNALRVGFRSQRFRHGLVMGALPKGASHIRRAVAQLRAVLEAAVMETRTEVSIVDAGLIATACRWEAHSMLAQSWLRTRFKDLSDDNRLTYSRDVARASSERDKAIASLRIQQSNDDALAKFYEGGLALDESTNQSDANDDTNPPDNIDDTDAAGD